MHGCTLLSDISTTTRKINWRIWPTTRKNALGTCCGTRVHAHGGRLSHIRLTVVACFRKRHVWRAPSRRCKSCQYFRLGYMSLASYVPDLMVGTTCVRTRVECVGTGSGVRWSRSVASCINSVMGNHVCISFAEVSCGCWCRCCRCCRCRRCCVHGVSIARQCMASQCKARQGNRKARECNARQCKARQMQCTAMQGTRNATQCTDCFFLKSTLQQYTTAIGHQASSKFHARARAGGSVEHRTNTLFAQSCMRFVFTNSLCVLCLSNGFQQLEEHVAQARVGFR